MSAPRTLEAFMAQALAMELEAVARYTEFADAMEIHNNQDVAAMFRTMAGYEGKHAVAIREQMGWTEATSPVVPRPWPAGSVRETSTWQDTSSTFPSSTTAEPGRSRASVAASNSVTGPSVSSLRGRGAAHLGMV